jgi:precorrin-2 dehydrogenase / sirohydrochlorin ferrochelatase
VNSRPLPSGTDTPYYPLLLNLSGRICLVIGGGSVAERKVRMLLKFGATVRLVSPKITKRLHGLGEKGKIFLRKGEYEDADLEGATLVFAATDREEVNARVRSDAALRNVPVNVADNPRLCDFIVPSMVMKGPISIAISTSGTAPSFAKKLRKLIDGQITADHIKYAQILGKIRRLLIDSEKDASKRKAVMKRLGEMEIQEVNRLGFRKIKNQFLISQK